MEQKKFKETMAKIFLNRVKGIKLDTQEAQQTPIKVKQRKPRLEI